MKYKPKFYAKAFAMVISESDSKRDKDELVGNFISLIQKNGDSNQLKKIFALTEIEVRKASGIRKVVCELARVQKKSAKEILKDFLEPTDILETRINPRLKAGMRIVVDDTEQLDNSLERKLQTLFS